MCDACSALTVSEIHYTNIEYNKPCGWVSVFVDMMKIIDCYFLQFFLMVEYWDEIQSPFNPTKYGLPWAEGAHVHKGYSQRGGFSTQLGV